MRKSSLDDFAHHIIEKESRLRDVNASASNPNPSSIRLPGADTDTALVVFGENESGLFPGPGRPGIPLACNPSKPLSSATAKK